MSTDTDTFQFHRSFGLFPAQLWHLLTDAQMREHWGAPGPDMMLTVTSSDLRVGGRDHHVCGPRDAPEFKVETRWYRLQEASDAVYTETVIVGDGPMGTSLVTYRLDPSGGGTDLYVTVAVSSFVGADAPQEFREGWEAGLTNLEALAAKQAA